jgi:hypothetical protein
VAPHPQADLAGCLAAVAGGAVAVLPGGSPSRLHDGLRVRSHQNGALGQQRLVVPGRTGRRPIMIGARRSRAQQQYDRTARRQVGQLTIHLVAGRLHLGPALQQDRPGAHRATTGCMGPSWTGGRPPATQEDPMSHDHPHDHPADQRTGRARWAWAALTHAVRPHSHDHADSVDDALVTSAAGIRATKVSLAILVDRRAAGGGLPAQRVGRPAGRHHP